MTNRYKIIRTPTEDWLYGGRGYYSLLRRVRDEPEGLWQSIAAWLGLRHEWKVISTGNRLHILEQEAHNDAAVHVAVEIGEEGQGHGL